LPLASFDDPLARYFMTAPAKCLMIRVIDGSISGKCNSKHACVLMAGILNTCYNITN